MRRRGRLARGRPIPRCARRVLARAADQALAQLGQPDAAVRLDDAALGDRPAHLGVDQQPVAVEDDGARRGAHARATANAISAPPDGEAVLAAVAGLEALREHLARDPGAVRVEHRGAALVGRRS